MSKFSLLSALVFIFSLSTFSQTAVVTGELKKFHKVTLTWKGKNLTEEASTFKDYRLNVTFTSPSGLIYTVPGYYAADGNAAESSASSGDKWRCHFNPLEKGEWSYITSFRTSANIAVSLDPLEGIPVSYLDGDTGTFNISETDKTGLDFRAKGKLEYVGEHFLKWTNGEYFLKIGTNSPEVFLEYKDFDNTPTNINHSPTPRDYLPHISDWNSGDPIWKSNKGKGIIGAVNYLSNQGLNSHYFMTDSSYGDANTVFPWVAKDSHYIFDTSKLDQWQIVFDHMIKKGIMVHFVLSETESESMFELFADFEGDDPNFANARKIYFRELVARFGYLNAITWNIGEENGWDRPDETYGRALTSKQQKDFAAYINDLTYYKDHITLQNGHANDDSVFSNLIGDNSFTGACLQGVAWNNVRSHGSVINWKIKSALLNKKWVISYDEAYHYTLDGEFVFRKNSLWSALMAGAAGFEFYVPAKDLKLQNYREYHTYWTIMRYAKEFFTDNNISYYEMDSRDELVSSGWCLGKDYEEYVIYLANQGTTKINLTGEYSVKWFDPRNGGSLQDGSITQVSSGSYVNIGFPPNNPDLDWVVLLKNNQIGPINVNGASLSPANLTIGTEQSWQLNGMVLPGNSDNTGLTWFSSNPQIASVDNNGMLTANTVGETIITIKSDEGGFTDTSVITVADKSNFCQATGTILMERFDNVPGWELSSLFNSENYPNNPSISVELDEFQIPPSVADQYGARLRGYLCAPESGTYYFWVSGDDRTQLNLSTDANPLNASTIAYSADYTDPLEWGKFHSQKSVGIHLEVGESYFIEAIMKEQGYGDHLAVAWNKPSDNPSHIPFEIIPGSFLTPFETAIEVTNVTINPNSVSIETGSTSQFSAIISPSNADNVSVNWSSNEPSIALVNDDGLVTAISAGTAIITVSTEDGGFTDESTIVVTDAAVSVTGVTVDPNSLSIQTGSTSQFSATISPSNADNLSVNWTSNDANIATVNNDGLVTAISAGTAIITVRTEDSGFTDESTVVVTDAAVEVTGVTIDPNSVSIVTGSNSQLSAIVSPSNADNVSVNWTTNDTNIATVNDDGFVTTISAGTAIITVRTEDGGFTDESKVVVTDAAVEVTGVMVNPSSVSIQKGSTSQVSAIVSPSNADNVSVNWSSNDTNIATVNEDGAVTAISTGTAIITVSTEDGGFTDESTIVVTDAAVSVTGVTVNPNSLSIQTGSTSQLSAVVSPSNAENLVVLWSSNDSSIVIVGEDGFITGISAGTAIITVSTDDGGFTDESTIVVTNAAVQVTGVTVDPNSVSIVTGSTSELAAIISPSNADNLSVNWSSNDTNIATVSDDGLVTAISAGTAIITVSTEDGGFTDESTIVVDDAAVSVTGITVDPNSLSIETGSTSQLSSTISPSNADNISVNWSSNDTNITTVNEDGLVTAISAGTTIITVSTEDGGFTDESTVVVDDTAVSVTGITVDPNSLSIETGSTSQLSSTISPSNADNISVNWSSNDTNIATVNEDGLVTAISAGTTIITVSTEDGGFTDESTVVVDDTAVSVTRVTVNPNSVSIETGSTSQLLAIVSPSNADNTSVNWSSNDTNVATVNEDGLVTSISAGTAIITVSTKDGGFTDESTVVVDDAAVSVKGVTVNPNSLSIETGSTSQLSAMVSPSNADNVSVAWSSNDTNIATVNEDGLVTGVSAGTVEITAITNNGSYMASSVITIIDLDIISNNVNIVYPNPVKNLALLKLKEASSTLNVKIHDVHGRLILNLGKGSFEIIDDFVQFSVLSLQDAIYFARVYTTSTESIEFKFIVKK